MIFVIQHTGYCGMRTFREEWDDLGEARTSAAESIREFRKEGLRVSVLERGREWEVLEPDDAAMVPDEAGILSIEPVCTEQDCACGFSTF